MLGFLKKILISLVCIALVSGTVFFDLKLSAALEKSKTVDLEAVEKGDGAVFHQDGNVYAVDSGSASRMVLVFWSNAVIRLAPESAANITISESEKFPRKAVLALQKGRAWINTLNSSLNMEINTPVIHVAALPGIFDIQYGESSMAVIAFRRSPAIEFSGNKLVIPEGRQIVLDEGKIQKMEETISKLRYSKLSKEFPYFEPDKEDSWTALNRGDDGKFALQYREKLAGEVRNEGLKLPADEKSMLFKAAKLFKQANIAATFDPIKKNKKEISFALDYFDSANYASLMGKDALAANWMDKWKIAALALPDSADFQKSLSKRVDRFAFAEPGGTFFPIKESLREISEPDPVAALQTAFMDVLDTSAGGQGAETQARVLSALRRFGAFVSANAPRVKKPELSADLFFEFVRFNDFLDKNPQLLREEFLKISQIYEKVYIDLLSTKEEADDQRQFFIAEKLKKIKALQGLLSANKMPFAEARKAVLYVADQIDELKPTFSGTAVLSYYDEQLKGLTPFITFLRSTPAENLRGSFQDNLSEFESRLSEVREVNKLLSVASGGVKISSSRREELAAIIAEDFSEIDAADVKVSFPEDEEDNRVKIINAEAEGKKFSALYDTGRKVFSDIVFDGEKIPNAVKLENFKKFVLVKSGKLALPSGAPAESLAEAPSPESVLERVAKSKLFEEMKKLGISVEDKYIGLEDLKDGVIHVRLALLGEGSDAKVFSFDVAQKVSIVSNLKVQTVSGEVKMEEEFVIRDLPANVEEIFKEELLEQQTTEEVKKFADEGVIEELPPLPEE